jgi:hypothetical protein
VSGEREKAWDRSRFFHEGFLEELLIPAQARDHDIAKGLTARMLAQINQSAADVDAPRRTREEYEIMISDMLEEELRSHT